MVIFLTMALDCTLEYVSCTSKAYDEVSAMIRKTCNSRSSEWCIVSIDKVNSPGLEAKFEETKAEIVEKRGTVREELVFHGTTEIGMQSILTNGFDPAKNVRSAYGRGTYVAPSAAVARSYAQETKMGDNVMIIARVTLGTPTQGSANTSINTAKYDYAVDNMKTPSMYVIPYRYGVIPLYVVQFYGKARM